MCGSERKKNNELSFFVTKITKCNSMLQVIFHMIPNITLLKLKEDIKTIT